MTATPETLKDDVSQYVEVVRQMERTHDYMTLRALEYRRRGSHNALSANHGDSVSDLVALLVDQGLNSDEICAYLW
jgi:hypothetical protein